MWQATYLRRRPAIATIAGSSGGGEWWVEVAKRRASDRCDEDATVDDIDLADFPDRQGKAGGEYSHNFNRSSQSWLARGDI